MKHRFPGLFGVLLAVLSPAAGALEWKETTLPVTTAPFQTTQEVRFEFANTGARPVAILRIETNCDCLDASSEKMIHAPGARGVIRAVFTVGDRVGAYERVITVLTDENAIPVRLQLRIEVPETVLLTPRSVAWKINDPADEKSLDLQPVDGLEIAFTGIQTTNGAFLARLETIQPNRHYRLHLRPATGTARPASAAIRVFGQEKSGHALIVSAYGYVQ